MTSKEEDEGQQVFDDDERDMLMQVFSEFNDRNIVYVLPRGYRELPESVSGGDVDVLVRSDDFSEAKNAAEEVGFERKINRTKSVGSLAFRALKKPVEAMRMLVTEPGEVYRLVRDSWRDETGDGYSYDEQKMLYKELQLHLFNHLAYTSPMNGEKIRVDPKVERSMLGNRVEVQEWYVPREVDELLHLLCRGIYDYGGDFPEYYKDLCCDLHEQVTEEPGLQEEFQRLLRAVFFEADDLIEDLCAEERFDEMRDELRGFSGY